MAILINVRWVDIPEDQIFNKLRRLGVHTWGAKSLPVAGYQRQYLFGEQYAYPYSLPLEVIERLARRLNEAEDMTWYRKYNAMAMDWFNANGTALNQALEYWRESGYPDLPRPEIKPIVDDLEDGDEYIAIIGLFHLTGDENSNNSHLFIDLIDKVGNRIYNHSPPLYLWYKWEGITDDEVNRLPPVRIDKPLNEPGANIGITWDQIIYGFHINNIATDRFRNIHTRYESDGPGNDRGHHSHYIVLQKRTYRSPDPGQPPPDPVEPPPDPGQPNVQISLTVNWEWVKSQTPDADGNITIEGKLN